MDFYQEYEWRSQQFIGQTELRGVESSLAVVRFLQQCSPDHQNTWDQINIKQELHFEEKHKVLLLIFLPHWIKGQTSLRYSVKADRLCSKVSAGWRAPKLWSLLLWNSLLSMHTPTAPPASYNVSLHGAIHLAMLHIPCTCSK